MPYSLSYAAAGSSVNFFGNVLAADEIGGRSSSSFPNFFKLPRQVSEPPPHEGNVS
jgi:hypothetical protein